MVLATGTSITRVSTRVVPSVAVARKRALPAARPWITPRLSIVASSGVSAVQVIVVKIVAPAASFSLAKACACAAAVS